MPLSWNEIRNRATTFATEWADGADEDADAKSFWDGLFQVYGVSRRRFATFETKVTKGDGRRGFIDLLWKKVVLVEHKSRGKDLDRAHTQAKDYFPGIKDADLPRYIIVCDFERFKVTDLETDNVTEFTLQELPDRVQVLGFIAGYTARTFREQDPVNIRAAEKLGNLHDELKAIGYDGHELKVYLVRLLFCLFADDTGIFVPRDILEDYIQLRTIEDGSDLGPRLQELFQTLNRPVERRYKSLDEALQQFPYVNGALFSEAISTAPFTAKTRAVLLDCCTMDWGQISPAIFGSLFQSIMNSVERRDLGAHYTSEKNILKAIGPLFLDVLRAEFDAVKTQASKLRIFHTKLSKFRFFDPACGCGNFLVIAYRELRQLELEVIRILYGRTAQQLSLDAIRDYVKVDVDQFHGIEIEEWPVQIARVAMWLMDHQMNVKVSQEFGNALVRVPLVKSANIFHGDALTTDWNTVLPGAECTHLLGNPPFRGARVMSADQKASAEIALIGVRDSKNLDLVAGWYVKAARYLSPSAKAALVSTSSITQGEQVGILWSWMLKNGVIINFAHRTFKWKNEASGQAAVHCVIIGFALHEPTQRRLFDYDTPVSEPHESTATNINPYLVDAGDILLSKRTRPISSGVSKMDFGSMANDGGALLLNDDERIAMLGEDIAAAPFIRPFFQVDEFLHDQKRWCLWLDGVAPSAYRKIAPIMRRIAECKKTRLKSTRDVTRELANSPGLFGENRQPSGEYLLVPAHTSEFRRYIPMGFISPSVICGNANLMVPGATLYEFGVMSSLMHMAWVASVCGRLESRFRYSAQIVYNNYPWPEGVTEKQRNAIEVAAKRVIDSRKAHKESTLADLYDPLATPSDLSQAHRALDRAVDAAYSKRIFKSDADRVAYLLGKYSDLNNSLQLVLVAKKTAPRKRAVRP